MATKQQIKRIKKLVDFLMDGVHTKKFDLSHWVGEVNDRSELMPDPFKMKEDPINKPTCNTSACVVGWFPYLYPHNLGQLLIFYHVH